MVSLIRSGPKSLVFASKDIQSAKEYLIHELHATEFKINEAYGNAGEDATVIFLIEELKDIISGSDVKNTLVIQEEPDVILCRFFSDNKQSLISRARIAPRLILLHAIGNMEKVMEEVCKDFDGAVGNFMDLFNEHDEKGTIINITDKPITKNVNLKDNYMKSIYIEDSFYKVFREMRMHALKYLNAGMGNRDWYEIEIKIFDRYSEYKLHYEKLEKVLDYLQLGLILGESWGKDNPRLMQIVDIYRVRFFTFYEPEYIKKILLGLEYLDDGTRVVDYDVFYNRKKIYWRDISGKEKDRFLFAKTYREEAFSKLSDEEKKDIYEVEERIKKTRY